MEKSSVKIISKNIVKNHGQTSSDKIIDTFRHTRRPVRLLYRKQERMGLLFSFFLFLSSGCVKAYCADGNILYKTHRARGVSQGINRTIP